MRTPNEVQEDILAHVQDSLGEERLQELLTELVFASRELALRTSGEMLRKYVEETDASYSAYEINRLVAIASGSRA